MARLARCAPGLLLAALALLLPLLVAVAPPGPPRTTLARWDARSAEARLTPADEAALQALVAADLRALQPTADGWAVAHPEQQLRYAFTAEGLAVGPLGSEEALDWSWAVRAVALQRDEAAWPLAEDAAPRRVGAGVRYERGPLAEWYAVRADGVEQGFTVVEAPKGVGPLRVVLRVATGLAAAAEGATAALWRTAATGEAVLAYRGLRAWDAAGRELAAWLEPAVDTLAVMVEDSGAAYPVTIDPLVQQAKLVASDPAANANFGSSVALSADGNTALIGAYRANPSGLVNAGAAYVFVRAGSSWSQQQKLTASDAAAGDNLGVSAALSADGNTALVGAFNANTSRGAAYVFVRSGTTWSQQQKLLANDSVLYDNFGVSVALAADGNTALIGAYQADLQNPTRPNAGAAYMFVRTGNSWIQLQKLTANDALQSDNFGTSVALKADGTTALIGAPGADVASAIDAGAAYAFAGCPAGAAPAARRAVDYDGNLRADFALWRTGVTGTFYIRGAVPQVQYVVPWGVAGDVPVRGDYNGDGCADFAVWRPSTGEWWVLFSSTGTGGVLATWGQSGDVPVPGDYDGDGKTDVAVWRPSTSEWWVRFSSTSAAGVAALWGLSGDVPVPGDYDGDGRTDYAVWRPSTAEWWVYNVVTGIGTMAAFWGQNGDKPLAQTPP